MHRLNHRVNILWNRHFIHHSSEDFNLSCALRQSISNTIKFSAIFMIPGALLGVPASIFAVLGPIHLFMQLWYHTQLIGNLGLLEYVTIANVNLIASLMVFVIPELNEEITSAGRFIFKPLILATIASIRIKKANVGIA